MADHAAVVKGVKLSDGQYNLLKKLIEVALPGAGALYFTLASIWGPLMFANADKVVGSIAALTVFLSLVLNIARAAYNASGAAFSGDILPDLDPSSPNKYLLELNAPMDELVAGKSVLSFKVQGPDA
jgi:hypothetical protein